MDTLNNTSTNIIQKQATRNSLNPVNTRDTQTEQIPKIKWVTFTYYSPLIRKIINLFRGTQLRVAFRPTNTITQLLSVRNTVGIRVAFMKSHVTHVS